MAFCEIDPYCRKVLRKHWPDVPIYDDIRKLNGSEMNDIGLICGGYPCQPFSVAGKRAGEEDDRHLWPEMYRIIKAVRPRWVIAENVAGHISMGLDTVLSNLEAEGYTCWPFVIPACAVDAKHRRDRVWIVANATSIRRRPNAGTKPQTKEESEELLSENREPLPSYIEALCADVADTKSSPPGHGNNDDVQEVWDRTKKGSSRSAIRPSERWPTEPNVGRVAHGIPRRVDRLKGLGNAVVPQIPEIIGRAIMETEANNNQQREAQHGNQ